MKYPNIFFDVASGNNDFYPYLDPQPDGVSKDNDPCRPLSYAGNVALVFTKKPEILLVHSNQIPLVPNKLSARYAGQTHAPAFMVDAAANAAVPEPRTYLRQATVADKSASSRITGRPDSESLRLSNLRIYLYLGKQMFDAKRRPIPVRHCTFRMINLIIDRLYHNKDDALREINLKLAKDKTDFILPDAAATTSNLEKNVHLWIAKNIFNMSLPGFILESFIQHIRMPYHNNDMTMRQLIAAVEAVLGKTHHKDDVPLNQQTLEYIRYRIVAPVIPIMYYQENDLSINSMVVGSLEWRYLNAALMMGAGQRGFFSGIDKYTLIEFGRFLEALFIQPNLLAAHSIFFCLPLMIQELRMALELDRAPAKVSKASGNLDHVLNKNLAATWNRIVNKYYDDVIDKFSGLVPLIINVMQMHFPHGTMESNGNENNNDRHHKITWYGYTNKPNTHAQSSIPPVMEAVRELDMSLYFFAISSGRV